MLCGSVWRRTGNGSCDTANILLNMHYCTTNKMPSWLGEKLGSRTSLAQSGRRSLLPADIRVTAVVTTLLAVASSAAGPAGVLDSGTRQSNEDALSWFRRPAATTALEEATCCHFTSLGMRTGCRPGHRLVGTTLCKLCFRRTAWVWCRKMVTVEEVATTMAQGRRPGQDEE